MTFELQIGCQNIERMENDLNQISHRRYYNLKHSHHCQKSYVPHESIIRIFEKNKPIINLYKRIFRML